MLIGGVVSGPAVFQTAGPPGVDGVELAGPELGAGGVS